MTREEFDKLYLDKAVHCDTEEKANEFLALADSVGYKWLSGGSLIEENLWEIYKEGTYYHASNNSVTFGDINYPNLNTNQIIEYRLQPKFKVGDKVRVKDAYTPINGKVGVIIKNVNKLNTIFCLINIDGWTWRLTENELEKVEEPTYEEETIEDIIEEIEYHQKAINVLRDRLKRKEQGENK